MERIKINLIIFNHSNLSCEILNEFIFIFHFFNFKNELKIKSSSVCSFFLAIYKIHSLIVNYYNQ